MSLIKWDPFREFNTLPARLAFWGKDWEEPFSTTTRNPSVDIFENDTRSQTAPTVKSVPSLSFSAACSW